MCGSQKARVNRGAATSSYRSRSRCPDKNKHKKQTGGKQLPPGTNLIFGSKSRDYMPFSAAIEISDNLMESPLAVPLTVT
jgi:hypothetical protein